MLYWASIVTLLLFHMDRQISKLISFKGG